MPEIAESDNELTRAEKRNRMTAALPVFTPNEIPPQNPVVLLLEHIPLLSGLVGSLSGSGSALTTLYDDLGAAKIGGAVQGFTFTGLAVNAINFVRIPFLYAACFFLGQKPPITLSNNLKLAYAATILGLAIASVVVGPAIAPILIFGTILVGAISNLTGLAFLVRERKHLQNAAMEIEQSIELLQTEFENTAKITQAIEPESTEVDELFTQFQAQEARMQELVNLQKRVETELKAKNNINVMDNSVAVILSTLAVIGTLMVVVAPVFALPALTGLGVGAAGYIVGRIVYEKVFKKTSAEAEAATAESLDEQDGHNFVRAKNPRAENSENPDEQSEQSFSQSNTVHISKRAAIIGSHRNIMQQLGDDTKVVPEPEDKRHYSHPLLENHGSSPVTTNTPASPDELPKAPEA